VPETDRLLDDYAARFARGERPDAGAYLARAGARADELRELIDVFLMAAPPAPAQEEALALMAAWAAGEPPLAALRRRRGRRRGEVVDAVMAALGIDPVLRARVSAHCRRLESGLLDLRRVDGRVLRAIADAIGATTEDLARWGARPRPAPVRMTRLADAAPQAVMADALIAAARPDDELDRLFGIGD
jgi:hypothetical protein